jgi:Uncharacterized protein conserved in bacteria (DUF2188)
MPQGDIKTYHDQGQWKNRIEGESGDGDAYESRDEAIAKGRQLAMDRRVEHIIRRLDGTFGERNTYGNDPRDIKG